MPMFISQTLMIRWNYYWKVLSNEINFGGICVEVLCKNDALKGTLM